MSAKLRDFKVRIAGSEFDIIVLYYFVLWL